MRARVVACMQKSASNNASNNVQKSRGMPVAVGHAMATRMPCSGGATRGSGSTAAVPRGAGRRGSGAFGHLVADLVENFPTVPTKLVYFPLVLRACTPGINRIVRAPRARRCWCRGCWDCWVCAVRASSSTHSPHAHCETRLPSFVTCTSSFGIDVGCAAGCAAGGVLLLCCCWCAAGVLLLLRAACESPPISTAHSICPLTPSATSVDVQLLLLVLNVHCCCLYCCWRFALCCCRCCAPHVSSLCAPARAEN